MFDLTDDEIIDIATNPATCPIDVFGEDEAVKRMSSAVARQRALAFARAIEEAAIEKSVTGRLQKEADKLWLVLDSSGEIKRIPNPRNDWTKVQLPTTQFTGVIPALAASVVIKPAVDVDDLGQLTVKLASIPVVPNIDTPGVMIAEQWKSELNIPDNYFIDAHIEFH